MEIIQIFPSPFLFSDAHKCPAVHSLPSHDQSIVIKALEPTVVLSLDRLGSSARFSISHLERAAGNRLECKRPLCAWNPDVNSVLLLTELRLASAPWLGLLQCRQSYRGVPARL